MCHRYPGVGYLAAQQTRSTSRIGKHTTHGIRCALDRDTATIPSMNLSRGLTRTCLATGLLLACGCRDEEARREEAILAAQHAVIDSLAAVREAERVFLRETVDHHATTLLIAREGIAQGSPEVQAVVRTLESDHTAESERLRQLLQQRFSEGSRSLFSLTHRKRIQCLEQAPQDQFDRVFREELAAHHREEIERVDRTLPLLTDPEIRQIAAAMRQDMLRVIGASGQEGEPR